MTITRRDFLIGSALAAFSGSVLARHLLLAGGSGGSIPAPTCLPSGDSWSAAGCAALQANLAATLAANEVSIVVGGVTKAVGYRPASIYNALWTRDHAYTIWHQPTLRSAAERRQFASYYLERRTTGSEPDPDGGNLPPDFIADRIDSSGTATYKNAGASDLPFMDGIAMVVLALWADWNLTGDTTTFDANQDAIDDCLAAIPRSANGCVYSDPAAPSVDYGFTDTILKTGDVAYGTALQAWAYKMCTQMAGESGSGPYTTLFEEARAGLATLRRPNGFYAGSSGNNSDRDDVWATALAVAEGLIASPSDCRASAQAIADAYADGSSTPQGYVSQITQFGLVRHLPVGQYWAGTSTTADTYQNGGYWPTPVWDCVRAVDTVDDALARQWVAEVIDQYNDERTAEGTWANVPYEWHNFGVGVGAKGYSPHAALVNRFI